MHKKMITCVFFAWSILLCASFACAGEKVIDFEDGASWVVDTWTGSTINSAGLSTEQAHSGKTSMKAVVKFPGAWKEFTMAGPEKKQIEIQGKPVKIGVWLYGDENSDGTVSVDLYDSTGQNFFLTISTKTWWAGWKYIEEDISKAEAKSGGNNDKVLDLPVKFGCFEIYSRKEHTSTFYFDDVTFKTEDTAPVK